MSRFIEEHRATFGVEPICQALGIAPSSYYAARSRPPSAHAVRDAGLAAAIRRVHAGNFGVYGVRKVQAALAREGIEAGRDRVARIMREQGLEGVRRGRRTTTTRPARAFSAGDLVERCFAAPAPDRLWVADITYVPLATGGFCYAAFVTDVYARRIVGWKVAGSLAADLALDALDMAIAARGRRLPGLVHHSDRGTVHRGPLLVTPRGGRGRPVGRVAGRQLRQRARRVGQRPLQGRARPPPLLARGPRGRARDGRLGRLVEPRPPPRRLRQHPPAEFEAAYHRALAAPPEAA